MEKWDRILKANHVVLEFKADRKWDVIRELTAVLDAENAVVDLEQLLAAVIQRERESSTGIGSGVAIPHAHEDSIRREFLAIGISRAGIEFDAIDGEPVHIVALLATPKKHQKRHMELLASLSRLLQDPDVRARLLAANDVEAVIEVFKSK
jgi:fructose-specific phosphotransferase system IIA component